MLSHTDLYPRIIASKNYIDQNYYKPLRLEHISKRAYMSRYHFHRLFTRTYGKTPHEYLTLKRLYHAKVLLQQEGISIQDVCNTVGFESLASFSLLFKKRNGFAPQYYRNLAYLKNKLLREEPARFIPHCIIENLGIQ